MNFLADIAVGFLHALGRVAMAFESPGNFNRLLRRLGWDIQVTAADLARIRSAFASTDPFEAAEGLFDQLQSGSGNPLQIAQQLIASLTGIVTQVRNAISSPPAGLPPPLNVPTFWSDSAVQLIDQLMVDYFQAEQPLLLSFLSLIGFVDVRPTTPTGPNRAPYEQRTLHWDRLTQLISDPEGLVRTVYGWGGTLDVDHFVTVTRRVFDGLRLPVRFEPLDAAISARYYAPGNPLLPNLRQLSIPVVAGGSGGGSSYIEFGVIMAPIPADGDPMGPPVGFALAPLATGTVAALPPSDSPFSVAISGNFATADAFAVEMRPGSVGLYLGSGSSLDESLVVSGQPAQPWMLLGDADGSHLEISGLQAGVRVRGTTSGVELILKAGAVGASGDTRSGATLVIDFSESDGFLQSVLGSAKQSLNVSGMVQWSSQAGLSLSGQAKLQFNIPLQLSIAGVLNITRLTVGLIPGSSNNAALQLSISGGLTLGPLALTVDQVGIEANVTPRAASDPPGNLDRLDLQFAFKPPSGLGVSVDAGVVAGGGYISFDPTKGQYAGALELALAEIVTVKAIGVLDTKLPNGQPGFSFLIIITTDFPPIQLSFGFTLNGVGGLCGINRTMVIDALRAGLRAHSLNSILFPPDPVANAPQIISDLESFFPPQDSRYVFGPMLDVAWGTPSLIDLQIGVILEVPDPVRLAIIGLLSCAIPDKDLALIELHIDVLGTVDFANGKLAIDGSLYDSRLLIYSLDGDMALRLDWGDNPNFLVSFGGFNPRFQPPRDVPQLHRMSVSIGDGDNPRLSSNSYLAITSNSFQFGANVDAYAAAGGFSIHGFIGYDALFIYSPFSFVIDFAAGFDVDFEGTSLASIHVDATISGPRPWHLHGDASFHILFFDVSASVDLTWGDSTPAVLPSSPVLPPLLAALGDRRNWSVLFPDQTAQGISLAKPPIDALVVHPMGTLSVRETVVPLDIKITKFGSATPADGNYFSISNVTVDGNPETAQPVKEYFALAQFTDMSDADKVSAPSYEQFDGGLTFGSAQVTNGDDSPRTVVYEERYIDDYSAPSRFGRIYQMPAAIHDVLVRSGAAFFSPARNSGTVKYVEPGTVSSVTVVDAAYTVASTTDLSMRYDILSTAATRYEAMTAMQSHLDAHPEDLGSLTVLPLHEVPA